MVENISNPQTAATPSQASAPCACGASHITITDDDLKRLELLRAIEPEAFSLVRDFARAAGSFGKLAAEFAKNLKK